MAKELDAVLDHGEARPAHSCLTEDGSTKFLEKIICPIYDTLSKVSCFIHFLTIRQFYVSNLTMCNCSKLYHIYLLNW